ncbi:domain of Kin17 curved DNA-binding protein-domain-containing protein [Chytriomyces cf. hyalinus JEL632]|nr:domain of Kin17 curved DNA-binding protein-domain-containing protein [Chytriomyces cf. hyalinus JEL632]
MAKDGFMTPKAIANRIKAKGLQKLRWYCQMCEKQCRDENGFKCHCASEAHQRQMGLFAENAGKYVTGFSGQFKSDFLKILRISHGTKRTHANVVYQEYIADRNHVHMNSTAWNSLNGFVRTLESEGTITLEMTEKGPFISWVDKSPETLARQEAVARKERMEKSEDERNAKLLEEQIGKAKDASVTAESEYTELQKDGEEPLKLKLEFKTAIKLVAPANSAAPADQPADATSDPTTSSTATTTAVAAKKPSGFSFGSKLSSSSAPVGDVSKKPSWMSAGKSDKDKGSTAAATGPVKKLSAMQQIMEDEKRKRQGGGGGGFPPAKRFK